MERVEAVPFSILVQRQRWWRVRRKRVCLGTGGCHIASARAAWKDMMKQNSGRAEEGAVLFCFLSPPHPMFFFPQISVFRTSDS